jgi:hypothetical protein
MSAPRSSTASRAPMSMTVPEGRFLGPQGNPTPIHGMQRQFGWDHFLACRFEKVGGEIALMVPGHNLTRAITILSVQAFRDYFAHRLTGQPGPEPGSLPTGGHIANAGLTGYTPEARNPWAFWAVGVGCGAGRRTRVTRLHATRGAPRRVHAAPGRRGLQGPEGST